jgi:hypothetical protein
MGVVVRAAAAVRIDFFLFFVKVFALRHRRRTTVFDAFWK